MSQSFSSAIPPYSSNGYALMNFIDSNERLVLAGDKVDGMGNYGFAAGGKVNMYGVESLSHVIQH